MGKLLPKQPLHNGLVEKKMLQKWIIDEVWLTNDPIRLLLLFQPFIETTIVK